MAKTTIAVFMGGQSSEHAVSLESGLAVLGALDGEKYDVLPVVITKEGKWMLHDDARAALQDGRELPQLQGEGVKKELPGALVPLPGEHMGLIDHHSDIDAAFIAMHGPFGEDGTLQGLLEMVGVPYTGSGVMASSLAMDKHRTAMVARTVGVKVPNYAWIRQDALKRDLPEDEVVEFGFPLVVKPNRAGSSVGVSIIKDKDGLRDALDMAFGQDDEILLQEYIDGREIHCGVLGNKEEAQALPLDEVIPKNDFYDYESKYEEGGADHKTPADLPDELTKEIQDAALLLYESVGCEGFARIDFFVREVANGAEILFNEINTIPGLTPTSIFPKEAAAVGIAFPALVDRLIDFGIERARRDQA